MTYEEYRQDRRSGCKDVVSAWLVVVATLLAMNAVLTLAGAPSCRLTSSNAAYFLTAATTTAIPEPLEAALRGGMLLAGVERPAC
jgi:hypothetical protein